ncbi:MAG: hypothetical protein ACWA5W_02695 [Phycisphaerales bacterium]
MQLGPSQPASTLANEQSTQPAQSIGQSATDLNATPNAQLYADEQSAQTTQPASPVAIEQLLDRLNSPNTLFVFGILLMVFIVFRSLRKTHQKNARRANATPSPHKRLQEINDRAISSMSPLNSVMVETEDLARRLGAALDNKAARLELLIEEADRKLAILNRSLASTPNPTTSTSEQAPQPTPTSPPTRTIDPSLLDRARVEQDLQDRQTRVVGRIEPQPSPTQPQQLQPEPAAHTSPIDIETPLESIQSQIAQLADSGLSNTDIAQQLNHPIGQVELILNLRKQQG